jgi:TonB family protein
MRVLLVDHDSEGLEAISRAIRGVLELDCVTSKSDALLLLRQNTYDVLIACERCVDGSGLDLLGRTTRAAAPLKRVFAAAPDRLQLLGPRLAPFKVQRTIAYPIDLEELWLAIAQVTGTSDDTDGTIERVVLDERGIPASGTTPRAPIPPRPPAPLREVRPAPVAAPPAPAPAIVTPLSGSGVARTATARMAQPAPEPPLRAPPPPRQPPPVARQVPPASISDTGRMRALAPPRAPTPAPAPVPAPASRGQNFPAWVPEPTIADDFAEVAAQARFGVQHKTFDEASRRKKRRLITATAAAVVVAAVIVVLIEKFYAPERAREAAIAAEVSRMAEQQKVTESLLLIENDIEQAIMENDLELARSELARLVQQSPEHPRREFLQASIDRAAELARLASPKETASRNAGGAETERPARNAGNSRTDRAARDERQPERVTRANDRPNAQASARADTPPPQSNRVYGAPLGDPPPRATIPLDAPINAPPATSGVTRRPDNAFPGRTVEASDSGATPVVVPATVVPGQDAAGSATVPLPPAATPAPTPPAPVDVVPAKLVRRVTPIVSADVPRRTEGYVVVRISISETGRVDDVEVVESTPQGVFDSAALSAVRKWVYEPRRENGVAVASQARARLVFEGE